MAARFATSGFWLTEGTASEYITPGAQRDSVTGAAAVAVPANFSASAQTASQIGCQLANYLAVYPNGPQL